MKTIEVTDEMYDSLIGLAKEMISQNPRGIKMPHLFQIRDWKRMWDDNLNGDVYAFIINDGDFNVIETLEEFRDYLKSEGIEEPDDLLEMWDDLTTYDLNDWINATLPNLKRTSYSWEPVYKNAFLTEKAAREHLAANDYHYHKDADVYLNHAWRNPEAELVSKFLMKLFAQELYT